MRGLRLLFGVVWVLAHVPFLVRADTLIELSAPYEEGEFWFHCGHTRRDSLHFPGIGSAVVASHDLPPFFPNTCTIHGYVSFDTAAPAALGYRYHDSIAPCQPELLFGGYHCGNPDTIWEEASIFPESLHVLDEIHSFAKGRYCYQNHYPGCGGSYCPYPHALVVPNIRAMVYLRGTNGRSLKVQVAECVVETSLVVGDSGDTCMSTEAVRMLVRWAADSAGNGLFKHDAAAIGPPRSAPETAGSAANWPDAKAPSSRPYFDLRGRPMARPSSGVYITPEGRALMIRRRDAFWYGTRRQHYWTNSTAERDSG